MQIDYINNQGGLTMEVRSERRLKAEADIVKDIHHEMKALVDDINQSAPEKPREQSPVERIADELAVSFGQAGQELLTRAQNIVADDEAFIAHIRAEIRRRVDIHTQFMNELKECDRDHQNARAKLQAK
jgi:hypothetical protein